MKHPSIQRRLTLGISIFTAVVLAGCVLIMAYVMKSALYEQVDADLKTLASIIIEEVELEHGRIEHEWLEDLGENPERVKRDYVQVWSEQDTETLKSPALKNQELPSFYGEEGEPAFSSLTLSNGKKLRAIGLTFYAKKSHGSQKFVMVLAHETPAIDRVMGWLKILLPLSLILVVLACIFITRKLIQASLRPISELEQEINKTDVFTLENQALTVAPDLPTELVPLSGHFNNLLERIGKARTRERNFSAHAAHEMRTPLAGIHAILEQALRQKRSAESYAERIGESLEITRKMRDLMNRLMHFSQLQSGSVPIHHKDFDLAPMIKQEIQALQEKMAQKKLRIVTEAIELRVHSDEDLLRIVLKNLLDNAVSYADQGTEVHVAVETYEGKSELWISNQTSEIQADDLEEFFNTFYRKDTARSADSAHYGLGLALCREISQSLNIAIHANLDNDRKVRLSLDFEQVQIPR